MEKENLVLGIGGNSGDNYFEYPVNSIKMLIVPSATEKIVIDAGKTNLGNSASKKL